jgi:hypothetical protein
MTTTAACAREALADALKRGDHARLIALVRRLLELTGPEGSHTLLAPREAVMPADVRVITAIYPGRCRRCHGPTRPGEALYLRDGQRGGMCSTCAGVQP